MVSVGNGPAPSSDRRSGAGTSAVWGTYQVSVQLPSRVSGNVTLEVYWGSPKDGSELGLVQVPLTVR